MCGGRIHCAAEAGRRGDCFRSGTVQDTEKRMGTRRLNALRGAKLAAWNDWARLQEMPARLSSTPPHRRLGSGRTFTGRPVALTEPLPNGRSKLPVNRLSPALALSVTSVRLMGAKTCPPVSSTDPQG